MSLIFHGITEKLLWYVAYSITLPAKESPNIKKTVQKLFLLIVNTQKISLPF